MKKYFPALMILTAAVPVISWAAAAVQEPLCHIEIYKYVQSISWYKGSNRIKIEADHACSQNSGLPLELSNVTLTIEAANKKISKVQSLHGFYAPRERFFQLGTMLRPSETGRIADASNLVVDLKTGEVRSPTGFYLDLNEPGR